MIDFIEIQFLVSLKDFPDEPFCRAIEHLDLQICEYINGGAISRRPKQIREIPDGVWYRSGGSSDGPNQLSHSGNSVHILSIPWHETSDDELTAQFKGWLGRHRPKGFPSTKKKGRNSGPSDGANHKLDQLGAYRLHRAGYSREEAKRAGFPNYTSEREWNRTIDEAEERIKRIYRPIEV